MAEFNAFDPEINRSKAFCVFLSSKAAKLPDEAADSRAEILAPWLLRALYTVEAETAPSALTGITAGPVRANPNEAIPTALL